jgi:predicted branched-subunit amino acid permease
VRSVDVSPDRSPAVQEAIRQAVSVSIATGLYGVSFGALAVAAGLDLPQTAGLLGTRNGLYGPQVAPLLGARGWRRPIAAQLTIDESTAVAAAQRDPAASRTGFWWTGIGVYVLWNAFTVVGALLGDALGDPRRYGLDAAAAAAFLGLVWPRLGTRIARAAAGLAIVVALGLTPFVPAGLPVLAAAAVAIVLGWSRPPVRTRSAA